MRLPKSLWAGGLLLCGIAALLILLLQVQQAARRKNAAKEKLPVLGEVADFALTNQNNEPVTLATLRGHVWIADIIFTTCPGPCRTMTREMKDLQDSLPDRSEPKLVSLTTFPDMDTPPVLKAYGEKFGADFNHWSFLTGSKQQIFDLANNSLKLAAQDKAPQERKSPNDLFIHSTYLVLVDKHAKLRAVYQTVGEGVDFNQVKQDILKDLTQLQREG